MKAPSGYRTVRVLDTPCRKLDLCFNPQVERVRLDKYGPFIRQHGRLFHKAPFPVDWPRYPPTYRCYDAAYEVAEACGLLYCEGFVEFNSAAGRFHLGHGWAVTESGVVVDPILSRLQNLPEVSHIGVPIKMSVARAWFETVGYHGLLDGFSDGTPNPIFQRPVAEWLEAIHASQ